MRRPTFNNYYSVVMSNLLTGREQVEEKNWFHLGPIGYIEYQHQEEPLVRLDSLRQEKTVLINSSNVYSLGLGFYLNERVFWGMATDFRVLKLKDQRTTSGFSEFQNRFKLIFVNKEKLKIAMAPEIAIPMSRREYISSKGFALGSKLVLDIVPLERLSFSLNLGYKKYNTNSLNELRYGEQLHSSIAASVKLGEEFRFSFEAMNTRMNKMPKDRQDVGELILSGHYEMSPSYHLNLGLSTSEVNGSRDSGFDFFAALKFVPGKSKEIVRIVEKRVECGFEPFRLLTKGRALTKDEWDKIGELPYLTNTQDIRLLNYGDKTGVTDRGAAYVKDSQVIVAFDFENLPPRNSIREVLKAKLNLKIHSFESDKSEIICIHDIKVCSGELFRKWNLVKLINKKYFFGKETPNDYYLNLNRGKKMDSVQGKSLLTTSLEMNMFKLIENVPGVSTLGYIYSGADPFNQLSHKTLYVIVADDSWVSDASIEMILNEDTCYGGNKKVEA